MIKFVLLSFAVFAAPLCAESFKVFPEATDQWKMAGPGEFTIADGVATAQGGMGLWWYAERPFRNAVFSLDFKLDDPKQNSGVFVRFPNPGDNPRVAVDQGYEVQISGTDVSKVCTGAIYNLQAPVENKVTIGEWNSMAIHAVANHLYVYVNGKMVNKFRTQEGRGDKVGFFGIQNHDDGSPVQFRNITVKELLDGASERRDIVRSDLISYEAKRNLVQKKKPKRDKWYDKTDFGPVHLQTWGAFIDGDYYPSAGLKGLIYRPTEDHDLVALFNTETLQWVAGSDHGVSLDCTPWANQHGVQNQISTNTSALFANVPQPSWPDANGSLEDTRPEKGHGNYEHLQFLGFYRYGREVVLNYEVGGTPVLETLAYKDGQFISVLDTEDTELIKNAGASHPNVISGDLQKLIKGGPAIFPETFEVNPQMNESDGPLLVDKIPLPPALKDSPWNNKVRVSDIDFFSDGDSAALCSWDGDVWLLTGLQGFKKLSWKRFASGLFEPLGLRIVNDVIHVNARDAVWQLIDLNDDQEADHYKVFNNDVVITDNFHEFTFGLETDPAGNFYFAKAGPVRPGGRNFDKIVSHNGTFLKLTPDGKTLNVMATGLRAPGGVGVSPEGEFTTGENEGTWQPCCKINYFKQEQVPVFLGTEPARHEVSKDFHEPLCYLPMNVDNSGGGQFWVPDFAKIGLKKGELLHLSYGQSTVYRVLEQELENGQVQGGVVKLPIKLSSSAQRAAFHPDGSMYVCGMRGWQTNAAQDAAVQRVRHNEGSLLGLPEAMTVKGDKLTLRFDSELDEELATDPESFAIKRWKYIRGPQYGSGQFSIDNPDEEAEASALMQESKGHKKRDSVEVASAELGEDGRTVILTIPSLKPAQQMEIAYDLETTEGEVLIGDIYSTIHQN